MNPLKFAVPPPTVLIIAVRVSAPYENTVRGRTTVVFAVAVIVPRTTAPCRIVSATEPDAPALICAIQFPGVIAAGIAIVCEIVISPEVGVNVTTPLLCEYVPLPPTAHAPKVCPNGITKCGFANVAMYDRLT